MQRLRFTHPEVKAVVVTSAHDRIFCAGANIYMLASATHPFKVNFCKYTNETRLAIEEASAQAGQKYLAACNGATAGGGYELALACDDIVLVDDGSSTVALPEVPLLAVLPGTGGLTRVVDKRKVRRDLADAFSTLAEGVKGKRALEWGLVDAVVPRSKFAVAIAERAKKLAASAPQLDPGPGIELGPLEPRISDRAIEYRHVRVDPHFNLVVLKCLLNLIARGGDDLRLMCPARFRCDRTRIDPGHLQQILEQPRQAFDFRQDQVALLDTVDVFEPRRLDVAGRDPGRRPVGTAADAQPPGPALRRRRAPPVRRRCRGPDAADRGPDAAGAVAPDRSDPRSLR